MNSKELLNKISLDGIVKLLTEYYGIEMGEDLDSEAYHFRTDCHKSHNEGSFKLYLYKDSKHFFCYNNCGSMSLIDLVMVIEDLEFSEAMKFLKEYFNIGKAVREFGRKSIEFEHKEYVKKPIDFNEKLPQYDEYILNTFMKYKPTEWIHEGISEDTMNKYEISFDIDSNAIIIPHRDIEGRLVGIRQRNLDERQVKILKRKYVPHSNYKSKIIYRHKLSHNLYGIHINKDVIRESEKCILWESEKSVLKMDSIYSENPSGALGGSSISDYQLNILKQNGCKRIYLAFDNEDLEEDNGKWRKKLNKLGERIINFGFECYTIRDWEQEYLDKKDAPIDKGKIIFEILLKKSKNLIDLE